MVQYIYCTNCYRSGSLNSEWQALRIRINAVARSDRFEIRKMGRKLNPLFTVSVPSIRYLVKEGREVIKIRGLQLRVLLCPFNIIETSQYGEGACSWKT